MKLRKGVLLLQTLVLCVIMSMIAVMVLKWVMARYIISARVYRSSLAKVRTEGCAQKITSGWNFSNVPSGTRSCNVDGVSVKYKTYSGSPHKVEFSLSED